MTAARNAKEKPTRDLVRVLLVPYGQWQGHHAGPQSYGRAECEAMVDYFNATNVANGKPMVLDYGHQVLDEYEAPAAGWIWSVEIDEKADPPGIYGMVEWTERAAAAIKGNEYRYISPVIVHGMPDPVTGEPVPMQLFNAALTNIPFMADKMTAVSASYETKGYAIYTNSIDATGYTAHTNTGGDMDLQKIFDDIKAALKMAATATADEVAATVKKLADALGTLGSAPEGGAPPAPEALPGMIEDMAANSKALSEVAALLKCDNKSVLAQVAALKNTAAAAPEAARLAELEAKIAKNEAETLVAANSGKIPPVDREFWLNRAIADHDGTKEILARMPEQIKPAAPPAKTTPNNALLADPVVARILGPREREFLANKNKGGAQ